MDNRDSSLTITQSRRFLRRLKEARLPFLPYGFLPAFGLGLVFLFGFVTCAKGAIEPATERTAQTALAEAGLDWAKPVVSGQWVTLEGTPPSAEAAAKALEVVRKAKASSPFGQAIPATRVTERFTQPAVQSAPTTGIANHEWLFRTSEGVLRLEGSVPDDTTRQTLVDTARIAIDPRRTTRVEDALLVTNKAAEPGFMSVALRGLATASRCDLGTASYVTKQFSLYCELPAAIAGAVEAQARAPLPEGISFGKIEVLAHEAVSSCETSLADLLGDTSIQFSSGSAAITYESYTMLDQIAEAIATCPGTLRIDGHTDSMGNSTRNLDLSLRRADAVRSALTQRGVPRARLESEGFGATRPVADNSSSTGRARNRRIEIRVVRSPG